MEEQAMFDILIEKTKKYLKKHPNVNVGDFSNGYLFPLLSELVDRISLLEADVDDVLESLEVPEQSFVQEVTTTVMDLVGFVDLVLVRTGWLGEQGPTEAFPSDLRAKFTEMQSAVVKLTERLRQASEQDEVEDDNDDAASEASETPAEGEENAVPSQATDHSTEEKSDDAG